MILILGGTTEGRSAAQVLEEAGQPFFYSTRGDEQQVELRNGQRLTGGMDAAELAAFCRAQGVRLLVDAAHPFAQGVHANVAQAARELGLPVVRYERRFPQPQGQDITWCASYAEAIERIQADGVGRLLALSGVQTIGRLRPLWQGTNIETHFRILDRDSSRLLAQREGFPAERLCYYNKESELALMQRLRPEAILTKESGESGGFEEKISAARQLGIRIYVVRRPALPAGFRCVDGPHGLRRQIEHLLPDFFPLHSGLTTGTCATAAALAALVSLRGERVSEVSVLLPNGEHIPVAVAQAAQGRATVIKDSGDDPDVTKGTAICAAVNLAPADAFSLDLLGGEGVGRVTLPGLGLPIGAPAINKGPQEMLRQNLEPLCPQCHLSVIISVPEGSRLAQRTFNPRLGIEGGISIIGTSGIIRPFSLDAFVQSIRRTMEVAVASGAPTIVINSGAKSEAFLRARFPELPQQAFVHYGNFIGETIKLAAEQGVRHLVLGVMMGKAVKLAEGQLDTHSKRTIMNKEFLAKVAQEAGCSPQAAEAIRGITLARELWDVLPEADLGRFTSAIIRRCHAHAAPLLPEGKLDVMLIAEDGMVRFVSCR